MTYRKPEIVTLGDASHTIQDGTCRTASQKDTPFVDGTTGCPTGSVPGHNNIAAYDLDE